MIETFLPNERRNFVHRRIGGAIKGFITGGPTGAIAGAITSGGNGGRSPGHRRGPTPAQLEGIRVHAAHGHGIREHSFLTPENLRRAGVPVGNLQHPRTGLTGSGPCPDGAIVGPDGLCINLGGILPGGDPFIPGQRTPDLEKS